LVDACRKEAHTAYSLIPALFERDITDTYQMLFAMSETIAHLNYLQQRGEVKRELDGGVFRYRA
jgi:hypothetical protein